MEVEERPVTRDFRIRDGKLPQWEVPGRLYFITASTHESFTQNLTREDLAGAVCSCIEHDDAIRYSLRAYVVMPNHVHVLLLPMLRDGGFVPLSEILQSLKGASAHKVNALLGRSGPVWLRDTHTRAVRSERERKSKWRYIMRNPVRAGLCVGSEDWHWLWPRPEQ